MEIPDKNRLENGDGLPKYKVNKHPPAAPDFAKKYTDYAENSFYRPII